MSWHRRNPHTFLPSLLQFALGSYTQNWIKHETDCCKNRTFYSSFFVPIFRKDVTQWQTETYQSGAILSQRWWAVHSHYQIQSIRHENHVAFLRKAYTWADMDNYNYHKGMKGIIQELKCLLKTKSISLLDQFNLLHINDSIP